MDKHESRAASRPPANPVPLIGHRVVRLAVVAVLILATAARYWAMNQGWNFDYESYRIVVGILRRHQNVYANTARYNYGPAWFLTLGVLDAISRMFRDAEQVFRLLLVTGLTLVDLAIAWILHRRYGLRAALIFFASPIMIIITGMHNQFDNLALLIGMVAMMVHGDEAERVSPRKLSGLVLLGISLVFKHLLFAFPVWLALKAHGWRAKIVTLVVPLAVFVLSFAGWWRGSNGGILRNVVGYRSFANAPFVTGSLPSSVSAFVDPFTFWLAMLVIFGLVCRRRPVIDSLLLYTLALVTFSPAIANQYLATVMPAVAVFTNGFFLVFMLLGTLVLVLSPDGLQLRINQLPAILTDSLSAGTRSYDLVVFMLACGLAWLFVGSRIRASVRTAVAWMADEVQLQISSLRRP